MPLPPLVLLPGLDGTATLFDPLIAALQGTPTQPVAYPADEPLGYDALEARVRAALPRREPYLVVAESFSGPIGIRLAADPPPGMGGLVLVASFAHTPVRLPGWLARPLLPAMFTRPPPARLLAGRLLGPDAPEALARDLARAVASVAPAVLAQRMVAVLEVDVRSQARAVRLPCLYLQATGDRVVPARCGRSLARLLPGLDLEPVEGPHLLLQRQPEACARAMARWWPRAVGSPLSPGPAAR